MPRIPRVRANTQVADMPQARQMAPTMNIHMADRGFEQAISEAGALGEAGRRVGSEMERAGMQIKAFVDEEKARSDKATALDAYDKYQIDLANYMAEQQKTGMTDPQTGAYKPENLGKDMKSFHDTALFELRQSMDLTEESYGMLNQMANKRYTAQEVQNVQTRANLYIEKTDASWLDRYEKALDANDMPTALMAVDQLTKSPKYAGKEQFYRDNAQNTIWNNEYIATMVNDPKNNNPSELEYSEMPDTIGGDAEKQKVKDGLVREHNNIMHQRYVRDADFKIEKTNEVYGMIREGTLSAKYIESLKETRDIDNKPHFDNKELANFDRILGEIASGKQRDANKKELTEFDNLLKSIDGLDPKSPQYKVKLRELTSKRNLYSYDQMKKFDSAVKYRKDRDTKIAKLPPARQMEVDDVIKRINKMQTEGDVTAYKTDESGQVVFKDGKPVLSADTSYEKILMLKTEALNYFDKHPDAKEGQLWQNISAISKPYRVPFKEREYMTLEQKKYSNAPAVNTVQDGYRYVGGNPSDKNNWEKVK